jgi:hypothetical protein
MSGKRALRAQIPADETRPADQAGARPESEVASAALAHSLLFRGIGHGNGFPQEGVLRCLKADIIWDSPEQNHAMGASS